MQPWAQWWLVITSPSGETKLPEQPPASRTDESRASSSHCESGAKPYFWATFFEGKLSYVHIPSSARAAAAARAKTASSASLFMSPPEGGARLSAPAGTRRQGMVRARAPARRAALRPVPLARGAGRGARPRAGEDRQAARRAHPARTAGGRVGHGGRSAD